ncbi:hypothetical protein B1K96_35765, partial [Escherichia coli]
MVFIGKKSDYCYNVKDEFQELEEERIRCCVFFHKKTNISKKRLNMNLIHHCRFPNTSQSLW